ncbi:protein DpdE [Anaeromyxobacter paludicola]|uniref:Uncharacterized protein n=1 Tax=Anaeromyxobacter paludicola TaxID=2918171 RepID=A0ABM7X9X2_9BACT|nr:protein DpdE [Anaeromyxobacter paludicola]BDG08610.1 hypothetical protein AMPC_17230 [Anaeromyxobacter paludicola]
MIGRKVVARSAVELGLGEIASSPDAKQFVQVDFYVGPVNKVSRRFPKQVLVPALIPAQTRCYFANSSATHLGRVLGVADGAAERAYAVHFPNGTERVLKETEFHVRSHLSGSDPVDTLAALAHESPYLFDRRNRWLREYFKQESATRGLIGLVSSKIELFPHQVEVVRRVLSDPTVRFLLADEVGLGKTIEAGAILRQLSLDAPDLKIEVFVPRPLVQQWTKELEDRFGILEAEVHEHEELKIQPATSAGVIVIDEAHRIVDDEFYRAVRARTHPKQTKHLLLLSATPVLHHEKQLLALLELLDPDQFRLEDLDSFCRQLEGRKDLGRTLLALSRTSQPAFILRHVRRCAELLPDDPVVTRIAAECAAAPKDTDRVSSLSSSLRIHLTESYRLHRRLLRTRRAVLLEEGDLQQRRVEQPPVADSAGTAFRDLWLALDEWRSQASAFAHEKGPETHKRLVREYLELAALVAARPGALPDAVKRRQPRFPAEAIALEQLAVHARRIPKDTRLRSLSEVLRKLDTGRWVGFLTDTKAVAETAQSLAKLWGGKIFTLTADHDPEECAETLDAFLSSSRALLLADHTAEEGLNLQSADGVFQLDLPFAPMRVEQRLGRLDRLDRVKLIRCFSFLSTTDSAVAFDAAWYEVLSKGLGVFRASVADLQFLVEKEVTRLSRLAFDGGPQALVAESAAIAARLDAEREAAAEQDILDGLYVGDLRKSAVWESIEEADQDEVEFGNALVDYCEDCLRLKAWKKDGGARAGVAIQFQRHKNEQDPLIPAEMLTALGMAATTPGTANRSLAAKRIDLELFRPGQVLVDEVRKIAEWDERGQAFAMWRKAPAFQEPRLVFRVTVRSQVRLQAVEERLEKMNWDPISRESLYRLLLSWVPTQETEVLLNSDGTGATEDVAHLCSLPYRNTSDINLGGKRAPTLTKLTGEAAWGTLCREMAQLARDAVHQSGRYQQQLMEGRRLAAEHFEMVLSRLRARAVRSGTTEPGPELQNQQTLRELVFGVLEHPSHEVDTIGVYVLSREPVCQR